MFSTSVNISYISDIVGSDPLVVCQLCDDTLPTLGCFKVDVRFSLFYLKFFKLTNPKIQAYSFISASPECAALH